MRTAAEVRRARGADAAPAALPAPPPAPTPSASPEVHARATDETRRALGQLHGTFVSRCIDGLGAPLGARSVGLRFSIGYDALGREVGRSITPAARDPLDAAIADCVRQVHEPVAISPPGTNLGVELTVELP